MINDLEFLHLFLLHGTCFFSRLSHLFERLYVFLVLLHLNKVHEPAEPLFLARHEPSKKLPLVFLRDFLIQDVVVFLVAEVRHHTHSYNLFLDVYQVLQSLR